MATEFKREHNRYVVIKDKDLTLGQRFALNYTMQEQGIPTRECVVIEAKWPIYEPAWDMVQRLAEGREQRIAELEAQVEQHKAAEEMQINLREKLDEDLGRHKRMFAAACESLGEIQKALGNEIVGIEPPMAKALIEERDALMEREAALAAHVEQLRSALQESMLLVENDLAPAIEGAGELDEDIAGWKVVLSNSPATNLEWRDKIKQAEVLEDALKKCESSEFAFSIKGFLHHAAKKLRQQADQC